MNLEPCSLNISRMRVSHNWSFHRNLVPVGLSVVHICFVCKSRDTTESLRILIHHLKSVKIPLFTKAVSCLSSTVINSL